MNPFLQLENSKPSYQSLTDPEIQKFHENTGELTSITHPPHPLTSAEHFIQQRGIDILLKLPWKSLREAIFGDIQPMWTTNGIEITGIMLSDHRRLKLEIKNRKTAREWPKMEIQQHTSKEDMGGRSGRWRDGWRRWRGRRVPFLCWALINVQNCWVMLYNWNSHYTGNYDWT